MLCGLVKALNEIPKLPKYILVVPDEDITKALHHHSGILIIMGAVLHAIIKNMDIYIQRRRTNLLDRKPGATIEETFPKLIWVRMLKRPAHLVSLSFTLRSRFNAILEDQLGNGNVKNHLIMSIEVPPGDFDLAGHLTQAGEKGFWSEVSRALQEPRKNLQKAEKTRNATITKLVITHKLPTPPPSLERSRSCSAKRTSPRSQTPSQHRHRRHDHDDTNSSHGYRVLQRSPRRRSKHRSRSRTRHDNPSYQHHHALKHYY